MYEFFAIIQVLISQEYPEEKTKKTAALVSMAGMALIPFVMAFSLVSTAMVLGGNVPFLHMINSHMLLYFRRTGKFLSTQFAST
jgi:hypothetical protein